MEDPLSQAIAAGSMLRLLGEELKRSLVEPLIQRILVEGEPDVDVFRDTRWPRTAFTCWYLPARFIFDAMHWASGSDTASACILCCCDGGLFDEQAAISDWNYDALAIVQAGRIINSRTALIDSAGRWAYVRDVEGYAILGGDPDWFATFLSAVGGRDVLLQDLRDGVESGVVGYKSDPVWRAHIARLEALK